MSTIAPFLVGLVSSGVGYAYLSRELVTSRNRIMLKHFKAEGVEPYYPPRRKVREERSGRWYTTPGTAVSVNTTAKCDSHDATFV